MTHASYLIAVNKFTEAEHYLDIAFSSNPKMLENGIYRYNWLRTKGVLFFSKEDYIKSIPFFSNAKEIAEIMDNTKKMALSYNDLGATYLELDDYSNALRWLQKSLDIYKLDKDNSLIAASLANIAEVYLTTEDYVKSLEYFNHAATILHSQISPSIKDNEKHERPLAKIYVSLANVYAAQEKYPDAINKLQTALSLYKKIRIKGEVVKVLNSLGHIYLQQSKIDQSLQFLTQAQKLEKTLESQDNIELKLNLTQAYIYNKNWKKAEHTALEGLQQSKNKQEQIDEAGFLESLATIYQNTNQLDKSIENLKRLQQLNKQIHEKRYNLSHAKLLNEIETTNEQRKLLALERQQASEKIKNNKQRFLFFMVGILLLGLVAYLLFLLNRKNKEKKENQTDKQNHSDQLALLSIKKEKLEQLFHGVNNRIICFDTTGVIHYRSPQDIKANQNENPKMQNAYPEVWKLAFPFLKESEKISKDLMLKDDTVWIHQMTFLDDILVCLIVEDDENKSNALNAIANIRKYSVLMRELSQFYIYSRNFPIDNSKKINQVLDTLKAISSSQ